MKQAVEHTDLKPLVDGLAGVAGLGAWLSYLPDAAALLTVIWTATRIYEYFRDKWKSRKDNNGT